MNAIAIGCLVVSLGALGLCIYNCLALSPFDSRTFVKTRRECVALSALFSSTSSATIYIAFVLLWAHSPNVFNGRQPLGEIVIWLGVLSAAYGLAAALAGHNGRTILLIVVSSIATLFLWMLAGVASVAV